MCSQCESQFDEMASAFDRWLDHYREHCADGHARDTPGLRVHDMAFRVMAECAAEPGTFALTAWFLAIAAERLTALESAGIPT